MTTYVVLMILKNLFIFIGGIALGVLLLALVSNSKESRYNIPKLFIYLTGFLSFVALYECIYINLP